MNRLGFAPAAFRAAWVRLSALPQVEAVTLVTHFADADGDPADAGRGVGHQLALFAAATADLAGERSLANSAATLLRGAAVGLGAPGHCAVRRRRPITRGTTARTGGCGRR